jgi:hypothetical protein
MLVREAVYWFDPPIAELALQTTSFSCAVDQHPGFVDQEGRR